MGAVLGAAFALGLLLLLRGLTERPRRQRVERNLGLGLASAASSVAAGVVAAAAVLALTGIPMAALLAAVGAGAVPSLVRRRAREQQRQHRVAAWPDAVDDLLTAVRAGVPLSEAICEAAVTGPEPLRGGFAAHARAWRRGAAFDDSLVAMQRHFADPATDRVVVSLALAAESGGRNVGRVLATQSEFLRSDLRMRGEIDARQSWTINGARVAVAAPWFAVAALSIRGESASAYATTAGACVLLATAVVGAAAYWTMTRIARLPQPQRLPEVGG